MQRRKNYSKFKSHSDTNGQFNSAEGDAPPPCNHASAIAVIVLLMRLPRDFKPLLLDCVYVQCLAQEIQLALERQENPFRSSWDEISSLLKSVTKYYWLQHSQKSILGLCACVFACVQTTTTEELLLLSQRSAGFFTEVKIW